jgi:phospholipid/cholesterol/gamma-HCH transport system permease protein
MILGAIFKLGSLILNGINYCGAVLLFSLDIFKLIARGRVRFRDVLVQIYEQGFDSILIVAITSLATGMVLGLQGYFVLVRFGAKDFVSVLVALSLLRELSPVLTSIVFSGKVGAKIAAELSTMNVSEQMLATRAMGVNPMEYFVVTRVVAAVLVLPILVVISDFVGIMGGYFAVSFEGSTNLIYYFRKTLEAIALKDFLTGIFKGFIFSLIVGIISSFEGFRATGGSLGVGRFTTKAVAASYILIIVTNFLLTKILLSLGF